MGSSKVTMIRIRVKNFDEIYENHKDLVYNLSLQYTQNQWYAEEITQDVFLAVYRNLDQFKEKSQLKTWIYKITINTSLNFLKSLKTNKRRPSENSLAIDDQYSQSNLVNFDHPGVLMEQKESMAKIFSAINQLSEQHKNVIVLLKIEKLSQKEVADILSLNVKAVESLFQRAKKKLLIILDKEKGNE